MDKEMYVEACHLVQEIVGDFVCMSRQSPEEKNMADDLMRLQNLLLEMETKQVERESSGDTEKRKTNADWTCKECGFEWREDNPFTTPGNCINCGSDYIQHY